MLTFSELQARDFYPGSAMFLEDNTNILKDSQRFPKTSRRLNSSEDKVIKKMLESHGPKTFANLENSAILWSLPSCE